MLPLVDGGPRKLVHGVFGTLMRGEARLPETPTLPEAVATRWRAEWGDGVVEDIARAIAAPPPLDLTLADPGATAMWAERLGGVSLIPGHVRLYEHAPITELPGLVEGAWWVQDLAASLPARLLGGSANTELRQVIDLCAAPGGKTLQLAAAGHRVTAVDVSDTRLARLRENLTRTTLSADIVRADALAWSPPAPVDAVLLDAPCSATGIVRRHPDVLYRAHPALIAEMAALQARLLARAADWVRPGGTLIYATCSLEPVEGEEQLASFLAARADYAPVPPAIGLPAGIAARADGAIRTHPGLIADAGGCDGFFIAALRRKG